MAEENLIIYDEAENSESSENLSPDEWTIIGDNCCSDTDDTADECNNSVDGISKDQEKDDESTEAFTKANNDATDNEPGIMIIEKHDEDSDGISVITESEAEQLVGNKTFRGIDDCKNHVLGALKVYEKAGEKSAPQVRTILNVVIACSLAAIIGLGAGRILGMEDKCPVTNAVDFTSIKIESENLINQIKELTEVKDVLDEIKASILPHVTQANEKRSHRGSKSKSKRSERPEKPSKVSDAYIFGPDTTILEQLQTSLNTLCSVIDETNPENDFIKSDTSRTQGMVADLIEFKNIIHSIVKEFEDTARPKEIEFFRHAEKRIRDVCESLLSDLSYTVHGMTMKIHHKLNQVRHKLNRRLCLLKSSESIDKRVFKSLEENNSFLESCDKILNFTSKRSQQSEKNQEKTETDKRIISKKASYLKKGLIKHSAIESEDESYLGDSSSDSSLPDLTYNSRNDNFVKKIKFPQPRRKEVDKKFGKILSEIDSKLRKTRNTKFAKYGKGKCFRKSITEVLVPAQSCPLTKEHWLELKSDYQESRRLEVPVFHQKPLYSTILKSDINVSSSPKKNFEKENPSEIKSPQIAQTIGETEQEFAIGVTGEGKKDSKETKHDVTPSESGINVQTMKIMKEQWNSKIREPVRVQNEVPKVPETLNSEKLAFEKGEKPEKFKGSKKGSAENCKRGQKCPVHDSPDSSESHKRSASTSSQNNDNKYRKGSKEKFENKKAGKKREEDRKKPKKTKREGKNSVPSKFTDKKNEKGFKNQGDKQNIDDRFGGDWQLQRSRAREMHRDRNHRSEWFFDRADSRQDARKYMDEKRSSKSGAGRFSRYRPCNSDTEEKCEPIIFEERIKEEEFNDYWKEAKNMNDRKHSNSRAGFTAKKKIKMPHRKNIIQLKRY